MITGIQIPLYHYTTKAVYVTEIMRKLFQILSRMGPRYFLFCDISSELCQFNDHSLFYIKQKG